MLKIKGYTKFILIGHSLGTIKAVWYLLQGKYQETISKIILLAPFDKNGFIESHTKSEWHNHLKIAEEMIKTGKGKDIIPNTFDIFPMTYTTYYSWYKESDLNSIWDFYKADYVSPILSKILIPIQVIIGDKDEGFYIREIGGSFEQSIKYLENNIMDLRINVINDGNHEYLNHEKELAQTVVKFISQS